jgi:biopolymer transport protein ExbB
MSNMSLPFRHAALALILLCSFPIAARAQDNPPASGADAGAAPAAAAPAAPQATSVADLWREGGFVMYILGAGSIFLVWFTVEGFAILRVGKLAPKAVVARLRDAISSRNFQEAWNICKANPCFLTNTTYLSVIGVVSPMVGLTGTVWGMIGAFRTLGANGISNPSELAGKIGEVLIATMSGLLVAVPAFIFFYVLRARAQNAILTAESEVYKLLDDIPYEQVSGLRIGENFSAEPAGAKGGATRSTKPQLSQKVSRAVTTNCPSCNAPIKVGTTPCPNCGTVLDWGG